VPLPLAAAVPTVVPPLVQVLGALACGPNTLKVIVPVGLVPPDRAALIEPAAIAAPTVAVAGAAAVVVVVFLTTVDVIPAPHVLLDALLLVSPP
jgi:hypothetical protein